MGDLLWQDLHDQLAQHQGRNTQNGLGKRARAGTTPGIDLYDDGEGEEDLDNRGEDGEDFQHLFDSIERGRLLNSFSLLLRMLALLLFLLRIDDYLESHKKKRAKQEPRRRKETSNIVGHHPFLDKYE